MLSFTKIVTLSAMALGTLTQAVPLLQRDASAHAPRSATDVVVSRRDTQTLEGVLDNLVDNLNKALEPITEATKETASTLDLGTIFQDVANTIDDTTVVVKALVAKPVDDILRGTNSLQLTVSDVVRLAGAVLNVVFKALQKVITLVNDLTDLLKVVPIVVKAIQNLLEAVIQITEVVFHDEIFTDLQNLVGETVYTTVLAALRLGAIVLIRV